MELAADATNNSKGTAEQNQEKYEESTEARLQKIQTKIDEFWIDFYDSGIVTGLIDLLSGLASAFKGLSDAITPIPALLTSIVAGVAGFKTAKKLFSSLGTFIKTLVVQSKAVSKLKSAFSNTKLGKALSKVTGKFTDKTDEVNKDQSTSSLNNNTASMDANTGATNKNAAATQNATKQNAEYIASLEAENKALQENAALKEGSVAASEANTAATQQETVSKSESTLTNEAEALSEKQVEKENIKSAASSLEVKAATDAERIAKEKEAGVNLLESEAERMVTAGNSKSMLSGLLKGGSTGTSIARIGTKVGTGASAGAGTGAAAAGAAGSVVAPIAITGAIVAAIYGAAYAAQKAWGSEQNKEKSTKAIENYTTKQNEVSEQKNTISSLAEEYTNLSQGVDQYGRSTTLTNNQLQRYKDMCNEIAKIAPDLVSSYDEQGNALLKYGTTIDTVNEKIKENERLSYRALLNGGEDGEYNEGFESILSTWNDGKNGNTADEIWDGLTFWNGANNVEGGVSLQEAYNNAQWIVQHSAQDFYTAMNGVLNSSEIDYNPFASDETAKNIALQRSQYGNADAIAAAIIADDGSDEDLNNYYTELQKQAQDDLKTYKDKLNENDTKVKQAIMATIGVQSTFSDLDSSYRSIIENIVNSVDPSQIIDAGMSKEEQIEAIQSYSDSLLQGLTDNDNSLLKVISEFGTTTANFKNGQLTVKKYQDAYEKFIAQVNDNKQIPKKAKEAIENNNSTIQQTIEAVKNRLNNQTDKDLVGDLQYTEVEELAKITEGSKENSTTLADMRAKALENTDNVDYLINRYNSMSDAIEQEEKAKKKFFKKAKEVGATPSIEPPETPMQEFAMHWETNGMWEAYHDYEAVAKKAENAKVIINRLAELIKKTPYKASSVMTGENGNFMDQLEQKPIVDQINSTTSAITGLDEAIAKLNTGNLTDDDLLSLLTTYPELADDTNNLAQGIDNLKDSAQAQVLSELNSQILATETAIKGASGTAKTEMQQNLEKLYNLRDAFLKVNDDLMKGYNDWQKAESTANAGDYYDKMREGLDDFKTEMKAGLVGTDDYQTYAKMFLGSNEELDGKKAYRRAKRYLTKDTATGVNHFADDLVKNKLATYSNGTYDIDIKDMTKAAEKMHMAESTLRAMLGKMKDYGADLTIVNSVEDGKQQLTDLYSQQADLEAKYGDYKTNKKTWPEQAKDKYKDLKEEIKQVQEQMKEVQGISTHDIVGETKSAQDTWTNYYNEWKQITEGKGNYSYLSKKGNEGLKQSILDNLQAEMDNLTQQYNLGEEYTASAATKYANELEKKNNKKTNKSTTKSSTQTSNTHKGKDARDVNEIKKKQEQENKAAETSATKTESSLKTGAEYTTQIKTDLSEVQQIGLSNISDPLITADTHATNLQNRLTNITSKDYYINFRYPTFSLPAPTSPTGPTKAEGTVSNAHFNSLKLGHAFAEGNVTSGKPLQAGTSLIGELGTELLVRNGQWHLMGQNGAETFQYKPHDIIFNHKQTKELLENGSINSRGKAFANGNVSGPAFANATGGYKKVPENKSADDSDYKKSKKKQKTTEKELDKFFDWIEVRLTRLSEKEQRYANKAALLEGKGFKKGKNNDQNDYVQKQMNVVASEITTNQKGATRYQKHADLVQRTTGLKSSIVNKIKNGTIDITKYKDKTKEAIEEYSEWYNKAVACKDAINELKLKQQELAKTKLDNIISYYESLNSVVTATAGYHSAQANYYATTDSKFGQAQTAMDSQISDKQKEKTNLKKELAKYEKQYNSLKKAGKLGSTAAREAQAKIQELNASIIECTQSIKELAKQKLDQIVSKNESKVNLINAKVGTSTSAQSYYTAAGKASWQQVITNETQKQLESAQEAERVNREAKNTYEKEFNKQKAKGNLTADQIREAQAQMETFQQNIYTAQQQQAELNATIRDLPITKAQAYLEVYSAVADKLKSIVSLHETLGAVTAQDYTNQIENNNKQIDEQQKIFDTAYKSYLEAVRNNNEADQQKYQKEMNSATSAMNELRVSNIELNDTMINKIKIEPILELIDAIEKNTKALQTMDSLYWENQYTDIDGNVTQEGLTHISNLLDEQKNAQEAVKLAEQKLNTVYANAAKYQSPTAFQEALDKASSDYQEKLKSNHEATDAVIKSIESLYQSHINHLKELIKVRTEALSKQKAMYDYDKNLKSKNKELTLLKQKLQALQGINTAEAEAQRQSLKAQITDAQQELDDTTYEHKIQIITDGLNDFIEQLDKDYELFQKSVESFSGSTQLLADAAKYIADSGVNTDKVNDNAVSSAGGNSSAVAQSKQESITKLEKSIADKEAELSQKNKELSTAKQNLQAKQAEAQQHKEQKDKFDKLYSQTAQQKKDAQASSSNYYKLLTAQQKTVKDLEYKLATAKTKKAKSKYSTQLKAAKTKLATYGQKHDESLAHIKQLDALLKSYSNQSSTALKNYNNAISAQDALKTQISNLTTTINNINSTIIGWEEQLDDLQKTTGFANGGLVKQIAKSKGEDGLAFVKTGEMYFSPEQVPYIQSIIDNIVPISNGIEALKNITTGNLSNIPTQPTSVVLKIDTGLKIEGDVIESTIPDLQALESKIIKGVSTEFATQLRKKGW